MPHEPSSGLLQIWSNPEASPQARRLTPESARAIELAVRLGFPKAKIAGVYGISVSTVTRVIARAQKNPEQMSRDLADIQGLIGRFVETEDPLVVKELGALLGVVRLMRLDHERSEARRPAKPLKRKKSKPKRKR